LNKAGAERSHPMSEGLKALENALIGLIGDEVRFTAFQ
jgi:hypothetical protein